MTPAEELRLREELSSDLAPQRELEIRSMLADEPLPQEDKGFFERVSEDLSERGGEVLETLKSAGIDIEDPLTTANAQKLLEKGGGLLTPISPFGAGSIVEEIRSFAGGEELSPSEVEAQIVGKGIAGSALDIVGEGLVSLWDTFGDDIKEMGPSDLVPTGLLPGSLLPESAKKAVEETTGFSLNYPEELDDELKQSVKNGWEALTSSDIGQVAGEALEGGIKAWMGFKQENPRVAKNIESVLNTALLFAPAKVKAKAGPTHLGQQAAKVEAAGKKQIIQSRQGFLQDLVRPKTTPTVLAERARRTKVEGGFFTEKQILKPNKAEILMAKEVSRVPKIKKANSIQKNLSLVDDEIEVLAKRLRTDIKKKPTFIPNNLVENQIDDALRIVATKNPAIITTTSKVPSQVAAQARVFLAEQPPTATGLLNARQALDKWAKKFRKNSTSQDTLTAFNISYLEARRVMNTTLHDTVPSKVVRQSLRKQSLLFDAAENMAGKAAAESNFVIGRLWQNATRALPLRGALSQELGLLFGLGGLGAAATFAPWITGAFGMSVAYYGTRLALKSAKVKVGISKLIKLADRAILSSKNPSMIKQLRADRAAMKELLENSVVDKNKEE